MEHLDSKDCIKGHKRTAKTIATGDYNLDVDMDAVNAILRDKVTMNHINKLSYSAEETGIALKEILKRMRDFKNGIYG